MAEQDLPDLEGGAHPEARKAPENTPKNAPAPPPPEPELPGDPFDVEPESVDVKPLILAAIVMAVAVITIVIVVFEWSEIEFEHARVNAVELTGYPQRREIELQATEKLDQYDVVNADSGIYRIPIDRAIELMVNRAYEQRQGQAAAPPPPTEGQ